LGYLQIIKENPDKIWDWDDLSSNPNITWDIIKNNLDKNWDWSDLSVKPNITWDIIKIGIGVIFQLTQISHGTL